MFSNLFQSLKPQYFLKVLLREWELCQVVEGTEETWFWVLKTSDSDLISMIYMQLAWSVAISGTVLQHK